MVKHHGAKYFTELITVSAGYTLYYTKITKQYNNQVDTGWTAITSVQNSHHGSSGPDTSINENEGIHYRTSVKTNFAIKIMQITCQKITACNFLHKHLHRSSICSVCMDCL